MDKKVLIVDDEVDIVNVFEFFLSTINCNTLTASNGEQALEAVKLGNISIVFLDIFLPDIMGTEVAKQIRAIEGNDSLPIIFISASEEKLREIPNQQNVEKLLKPVGIETITAVIDKYLKKSNES